MKKENSTNSINRDAINAVCATAHALAIFGGRWKATIIHILFSGKLRFGELKKIIPGVSEKMLVLQLKELEKDGIVKRTVFPEVPPRVEYELTALGWSMKQMLESISQWGMTHKISNHAVDNDIDKDMLSNQLNATCDMSKYHPSHDANV